MASSKEYLEFILGQLSELEEITYRAMMGEFIIYYRGKAVDFAAVAIKHLFQRPFFARNCGAYRFIVRHFLFHSLTLPFV